MGYEHLEHGLIPGDDVWIQKTMGRDSISELSRIAVIWD
jgi:hypothetical protein